MWVHYDNRAAAQSHLIENGWAFDGACNVWFSHDRQMMATIHPKVGQELHCILFNEVPEWVSNRLPA